MIVILPFEESIFVIFYCCIYQCIMYACLLELVLKNTCVNIYWVFFFVIFLNTCHICIHLHRLVPCSGWGTLYEHWIQSQPFYNIDLFCYTWWYAPAIACYQHSITLCAWLNIQASRNGVWVLEHGRQQKNISGKYSWCNIIIRLPTII